MLNSIQSFLFIRGLVEENAKYSDIQEKSQQVYDSLIELAGRLNSLPNDCSEENMQSVYYDVGKIHFSNDLRYWFRVLYQLFFKENEGPRLGQFTTIMSVDWVINKINDYTQENCYEKMLRNHKNSS